MYVGKMCAKKMARHPVYRHMSAEITFLGQFQPELAVRVRKLSVLAHQVMKHVGGCCSCAAKVAGFERLLTKV
jgi:hypothetical protein